MGPLSSFTKITTEGIAEDGGLYIPSSIPKLPSSFFRSINKISWQEIMITLSDIFVGDEIPRSILEDIIEKSLSFDIPLIELEEHKYSLELFYGPTLSFKDIGARIMAGILSYLAEKHNKEFTVLVATAGDTGSAVANAFYKKEGINVILLYPSKRISNIQEQQITTYNANIHTFEVQGIFDDCLSIIKRASTDPMISTKYNLTYANSINFARFFSTNRILSSSL